MDKKQLKVLAKEAAAQDLNSEEDIARLIKLLRQSFYGKALDAELDDHLVQECHESRTSNSNRNGYTKKTVQSYDGVLKINTPHDHQSEFSPQIISRSWRNHWANLNTLFLYPKDIRKAIYTTNAIESLNNVIRK